MNNIQIVYKAKIPLFLEILLPLYLEWIKKTRDFETKIKIFIHNKKIYSDGSLTNVQTLKSNKSIEIFFSIQDIEDYLESFSYYTKSISAEENASLYVLNTLCYELSKVYCAEKNKEDYDFFIENLDENDRRNQVNINSDHMTYSFYFNELKRKDQENSFQQYVSSSSKEGLKLKYNSDINENLKKTFKQFTIFIKKQIEFPIEVKTTVTNEIPNRDCVGYFEYPTNPFQTLKIVISTEDYNVRKKELGEYDALLNILRIFAHEIGHYHSWINNIWFYDMKDEEQYAEEFEEKYINKFIDDAFYDFYERNIRNQNKL